MNIHCFVFNPFSENTYLIWNSKKEAILIDPGCCTVDEQEQLSQFIKFNSLIIRYLYLTHAHIDHVLGLHWINAAFGLIPRFHLDELIVYQNGPAVSKLYGLGNLVLPGFGPFIKESVISELDELTFEIIFTPGHSPGSICFYNKEANSLISGDVLFDGSIGRTDLPGGNYETLISSIQDKLMTLPDDTIVYSGHGPTTTIGKERISNPFLV
ncbi:MAG: MBL fold metallo-hydrolase [Bacteroidota bacterium]|nr:MBL fold metallo-hydrolase [Bacteroidota bacterium]